MTIKWVKAGAKKRKDLPALMDTGLGKVWYKLASNPERAAYGLPMVENGKDLPAEDMIALYENGMKVSDIARKFGCSVASVNLRVFGQKSLSDKFRTEIEMEKVKELRDTGLTVKALAERFGCSETLIRRRLYAWDELHNEKKEEEDENERDNSAGA